MSDDWKFEEGMSPLRMVLHAMWHNKGLILLIVAYMLFLIFFVATPAEAAGKGGCYEPQNHDTWGIREPNQEEIFLHGKGILVFEYYNHPAKCSQNLKTSIKYISPYYGMLYFMMEVRLLGTDATKNTDCVGYEQVTLDPSNTPYILATEKPLIIPDIDQPYKLILYPAMF